MPSPQQPIGSGFGAASTAADVIKGIDLSGRTAVVTGGHSGLGLETTRALRPPAPPLSSRCAPRAVPATCLGGSTASRSTSWT